ncbi:MAG TPA: hypothetical protein VNA88_04255 [Candidatus Kapabacteria bacterium]|nr:hypothetical protein [Candidatus Kapabacteria bacterium]HVK37721.1 hypothetical protein [Candidatus Kapabacteria bacterium]
MFLELIERVARPWRFDARYELGTPSPHVRALEKLPGYVSFLVESVRRAPASSIWRRTLPVDERLATFASDMAVPPAWIVVATTESSACVDRQQA